MAITYATNIYSAIALDCVNNIIGAIGEPPVTTLDTSNADVVNALRILDSENRKLQSEGWTFNIELNQKLIPDSFSKLISWSPSFISVLEPGSKTKYINRAGYVYDRINQTNQFTSSITVNLIRIQELDEMPDCFLQLIIARSCKRFNNEYFGAGEISAYWQEEEQNAKILCMEYECDYSKYNMLTDDEFVQFQRYR
ncbi:TPA: phage tail protein [Enterobacter roggenkampii]